MTTRNIAAAAFILISGLFGTAAATANATPVHEFIAKGATLHCGIHYKATTDRNGRVYCKFSPDPRHRGGNGNARHAG
jgi:hypothetical protein